MFRLLGLDGLVGLMGESGLPTHVINNDSNSQTMVW